MSMVIVQEVPLAPTPISRNMKYVEEKPVNVPLSRLEWSPKMDLVAVGTNSGDAQLYRLNWTRIWSRPPMEPGTKVNIICWRPDGRIVAFAYSTGEVMLREIENGETVHFIDMDAEVTCMRWTTMAMPKVDGTFAEKKPAVDKQMVPTPPPLSKCFGMKGAVWDDKGQKKVMEEAEPSILVVSGCSRPDPMIKFFAHGVFLCGSYPLKLGHKGFSIVRGAVLSDNCKRLFVISEDFDARDTMFQVFDCSYLADNAADIVYVAKICAELGSLMQYSSRCMQGIREGVENLAMEFESKMDPMRSLIGMKWEGKPDTDEVKLRRYEILAQMAEFEAFGCMTQDPENDFIQELSTRGVRKLRAALEQGHTSVQALLTEYFAKATTAIVHCAAKLRGLARCQHRLGFLGLDEKAQGVLATSYQLVHKTREFQFVLTKAFLPFKDKEKEPEGSGAATEELSGQEKRVMREFVAGMIEPFVRYEYAPVDPDVPLYQLRRPGCRTPMFEPISQYVKEDKLMFVFDEQPAWEDIMASGGNFGEEGDGDAGHRLKEGPDSLVFDEKFPKVSLAMALKQCVDSIQAFIEERKTCGRFSPVGERYPLFPLGDEADPWWLTVRAVDDLLLLKILLDENENMKIALLDPEPVTGDFGGLCCNFLRDDENGIMRELYVNDADFYSPDVLSILLYGNSLPPTFYQAPLKDLRRHIRLGEIYSASFAFKVSDTHILDDVSIGAGTKLAVSGTRKVAAILFKDKMRIRIMETEYEEDEDEEDVGETSRDEGGSDTTMAEVHTPS